MRRKWRVMLILLFMLGIGTQIFTSTVRAEHKDIRSTIFQYLRLIEDKRYDAAVKILTKHKDKIVNVENNKENNEENQTLSLLYEQNRQQLNASPVNEQQLYQSAVSLTLVLDAVTSDGVSPVWKNWQSELTNKLSAIVNDTDQISQTKVDEVITYWEIISPVLVVTLNDVEYEQIASVYQQLQTNSNKVSQTAVKEAFRQTKLLDVTSSVTTEKESSTFVMVLFIVGGFITLTLSYVGWKKYKGNKNKKRKTEKNS
ncbi:sporulation protein YpjB [Aquibacillus sp. 3ASR75-11]|uniref:Sporulation protein YpjB n=1 Tax=Terrihalobacillus insolitus TaxID=2950438 RepID=A0A9X4AMF2_9BACI|nr:sporulation protein YpjB [Terrihalobacillus insolitus]MDC3413037.1 sporulation protein YpjB [Terrihalobacillus insolitus]MDC3424779.1 sporulation protein YpjB [Terrihalobacillus insolitus]